MPAPTFIVRNSAGAVVFDAEVATFGCVADVVSIAAGASPTYTYPVFAGRTVLVVQFDSGYRIDLEGATDVTAIASTSWG